MGVSQHEARRLARVGELLVVGQVGQALLLDAASVHRAAQSAVRRGRPWDQRTAWAAIDLLNTGKGAWLSYSGRSRLRAKLSILSAKDFSVLSRRRAQSHTFRASTSFLAEISPALVLSAAADTQRDDVVLRLVGRSDPVEGYTDAAGLAELIDAFHLVADISGNVTVHEAGQGHRRRHRTVHLCTNRRHAHRMRLGRRMAQRRQHRHRVATIDGQASPMLFSSRRPRAAASSE